MSEVPGWYRYHSSSILTERCSHCGAEPRRSTRGTAHFATGRLNPDWRYHGLRGRDGRRCGYCYAVLRDLRAAPVADVHQTPTRSNPHERETRPEAGERGKT